ncbi:amino acid permease [Streptomyces sp. LX-29]|uniref:APC family permease n=1 Tax=Streptomyces sp. LX-29 TaxID=2900152 RepID=UPI00240D44EB|nr:amino acid permease [Streptomyces sp. LX-29]WFB06740.1 amino acid permease [Streptomyces sp. LX-29]
MSRSTQAPPTASDQENPANPGGLNLAQGTALYVGAVLGTGVLALPGLAAKEAGPASLLAWLGLVVMSVPLAAAFAALAARYPDAGGVSTYVRRAFGGRAATAVGWWFYLGAPVGIPALAFFGAEYLSRSTGGGWGLTVTYAGVLLVVGFVGNAFGVRISGRIQLLLSGALALLLVLAIVVVVPDADTGNLTPFAPEGWASIGTAGALLVWSFTGWETVTHLSAEFSDPARNVKRATAGALLIVGVLYLSLAAVTVLVLGDAAGDTTTPLASLLETGLGSYGDVIASVVALLVTLGTMNAYIASTAKLGAALARDGSLPAGLGSGAETGGVPRRSLLVVAGISGVTFCVAAVTEMDLEPLILSTTACLGAVYAIGAAAGIKLLRGVSRAGTFSAACALVIILLLLALTGWFMIWPAVLGAAALLRPTARRSPTPESSGS